MSDSSATPNSDLDSAANASSGQPVLSRHIRAVAKGVQDAGQRVASLESRLPLAIGYSEPTPQPEPGWVRAVRVDGVVIAGQTEDGSVVDTDVPGFDGDGIEASRVTYDIELATSAGLANIMPVLGRPAVAAMGDAGGGWPVAVDPSAVFSGFIVPARPGDQVRVWSVRRHTNRPRSISVELEDVYNVPVGDDGTVGYARLEVMTEQPVRGKSRFKVISAVVVPGFEPGDNGGETGLGGGGRWVYTVRSGTEDFWGNFVPTLDAEGATIDYRALNTYEASTTGAGARIGDLAEDSGVIIKPVKFGPDDGAVVEGSIRLLADPDSDGELVPTVIFDAHVNTSFNCGSGGGTP